MAVKSRVSVDESLEFDQYLSFNGTQSAANSFLQITIPTKVSPNNGYILVVKEVIASVDTGSAINSFSTSLFYSLTRATKVAIPIFTDPDIIAKGSILGLGGGTFAAGTAGQVEQPINVPFVGKQIIASENVYFQFQTNGNAAVVAISGRIYYEQLNLPKDRILEILYG